MIEKVSRCLLVVGGLDDELSNGRTRRRPRLSDPPERGDGWRLCTGTPQPEMHFPNLTQGRLAGYDAWILFTEKRKMYASCVAHFDTWLKHALAQCILKTNPFPRLANAPLGPLSINRSIKKGDRMHLSKFNMIWSKLFICLTSATKDNYLNPPGARHKGKCRATQIFHISSSSSTCRHSLSASGIKQTLWA